MSQFEIECRPCGAMLLTPLLTAAVRFDKEHADCGKGGVS